MHVAPIITKQWEPESDYERWVSRVVDENPELTKCEMVAGDLVTRCVFLRIGGQDLIVHLERTICETCGFEEDDCAVPDFGCGDSEYSAFISALPRLNCSGCNQPYERRMVIWQSNKTNLENKAAHTNPLPPTTAPELKSEGNSKPKPESEGRSQ